ncbi:MAG TPA: SRPBCC family protein [Candidatus Dormibacteraeota bacterium]
MAADYHFVTRWRLPGTREEVVTVLRDPLGLPRWWPSVYLDVQLVREGGPDGVGREVSIYGKGWLPYTIRWRLTVTRDAGLAGMALRSEGDFVGMGTWAFKQEDDHVIALYDWRVRVAHPLMRRLTWLLRPAFSANHHWAMRQGELSLRRELERRRAGTDVAASLPPPPQPTFMWLVRRGGPRRRAEKRL